MDKFVGWALPVFAAVTLLFLAVTTVAEAHSTRVVITHPVAHASTTEAQATATFAGYARGYCGDGTWPINYCVYMNGTYCNKIGVYTFSCTSSWLEHYFGGFRSQYAWGQVFQGWVSSFNYRTT